MISFITNSCIEPFEFETIDFEDTLVIEATITNELKYHEINLTRTFKHTYQLRSLVLNLTGFMNYQ